MKYSEILNYIKTSTYPDKEKIRMDIYEKHKKSRKKALKTSGVLVISILLILIGAYTFIQSVGLGSASDIPENLVKISPIASVRPTSFSGQNITLDTDLKIVTSKPCSKKEFKEVFKVSPKTNYSLIKTSGNTFTVKFENKLSPNTVYSINSVADGQTIYSWAYQTETKFEVTGCFPNTKNINPTDTVYVEFTHSNTENFIENFSIYPSISGTFEQYGNRWMFIPSGEFEKDILYTVTINKSVSGGNSETLEKDYSFSFCVSDEAEQDSPTVLHSSNDMIDTFSKNTVPLVTVSNLNTNTDKVDITVYKIPSVEEFISVHQKHASDNFISAALGQELQRYDKLTNFTAVANYVGDTGYIYYPSKIISGQYVAEITTKNTTLYQFLQITDLSVYTVTSSSDCTVWVNNTSTKLHESGAQVTLSGENDKTTDKNGIVFYDNPTIKDGYAYICVKSVDDNTYASRIVSNSTSKTETAENSYHFMAETDNSIYKIKDTVKLFGFISSDNIHSSKIQNITANYSWTDEYDEIPVSEEGTFEQEIILPQTLKSGNHFITLKNKDTELAVKTITVSDSISEDYNVRILTEKDVYFENETVNYNIFVQNKNGIPVSDLNIELSDGSAITTDKNGIAKYQISALSNSRKMTEKFTVAHPSGIKSVYLHDITVYESDLTVTAKHEENKITATVTDTLSGKLLDTTLNIELHRVTLEKKAVEGQYDPVTKTYKEEYVYTEKDEITETLKLNTKDGECFFNIKKDTDADSKLYYKITAAKKKHNPAQTTVYLTDDFNYSSDYDFTFKADKESYKILDSVKLTAFKNGKKTSIEKPLLLSFVSSKGIVKNIFYKSTDAVSFECINELCGNTQIYAAYFDGENIHDALPLNMFVQRENFNIQLETDKKEYRPGETVTLDIKTLENSNTPVSALLCLNVSDSSLEHQNKENVSVFDVTTSNSHYEPSKSTDKSHNLKNNSDSDIHFINSPFSTAVKTDSLGKATISFVLPETENCWTVTVSGISENGTHSTNSTDITAFEDFDIVSNIKNDFSTDEDCEIRFGFNSKNIVYKECVYSVTLLDGNIPLYTHNGTVKANTTDSRNFGKLPEGGDYKVRISVKCGSFYKARDFGFKVDSATASAEAENKLILEQPITKDTSLYPSGSSVTVFDEQLELTNIVANTLKSYSVKNAAGSFAPEFFQKTTLDLQDLEKIKSSIPTDIKDLAVYTAVFNEYLDANALIKTFENTLYKSANTTAKLCCYLGLSALDMPLLNELYVFESNISNLSFEEKIYLALSFAYSGDYNSAYEIYENHIEDKIKSAGGIAKLDFNGTAEENAYISALISHLSSKISAPYAKEIVKNLINSPEIIEKYSQHLIVFVKDYIPNISGKNKIDVIYPSGKKQKITYYKFKSYIFDIPENEKGSTLFTPKKGISILNFESVV